jgi:hypothetical protein
MANNFKVSVVAGVGTSPTQLILVLQIVQKLL